MDITKALRLSREQGLDLVQVTEKVEPPICKILDYGKYLYSLQKKEGQARKQQKVELKSVRLRYNISVHDMETRARQAVKFLKKGDKVKIEMKLRGREKGMRTFAREKMDAFIEIVKISTPVKIE